MRFIVQLFNSICVLSFIWILNFNFKYFNIILPLTHLPSPQGAVPREVIAFSNGSKLGNWPGM